MAPLEVARFAEFADVSALTDVAMAGRAFPRPAGATLAYGVAGFRARAGVLESTLLRMGMLAALRSRDAGYAVGLMVTASHNAEPDNGVKMVDVDGGMLARSWEARAEALANADDARLDAAVAAAAAAAGDGSDGGGAAAHAQDGRLPRVLIAWDTRPSSPRLAALAARGVALCGGEAECCGLLTTPQLHHLVRFRNGAAGCAAVGAHYGRAEWASEAGYFKMLATAYADLLAAAAAARGGAPVAAAAPIAVDCACGVGAPKTAALAAALAAVLGAAAAPQLRVVNAPGEAGGVLNLGCGAEHVQKARAPPRGLESAARVAALGAGRAASLDGDADRIVFHFWRADGSWALLDGDKIAALIAGFVVEHLDAAVGAARPASASTAAPARTLSAGVVQTAYANGASTAHLRRADGLAVAFAKTGVKYAHHAALRFDLAVYFEANGHGALLFSQPLLAALHAARARAAPADDGAAAAAVERARASAAVLLACHQLVNQAVGDALSDLLLVDAILRVRGWGLREWDGLYADLPSRQTKLTVRDRTAITVTDDETRVLAPAALQDALDGLTAGVEGGRCFVRPSGTEDAVRVYAEAASQPLADALALGAARAVHALAGGVGAPPDGFAA